MLTCTEVFFSGHAIRRMFDREINRSDVLAGLHQGEIILEYTDDKPYPSYLVLYFKDALPLHIVVAENKVDNSCYVITAYTPSIRLWEPDFKKRKIK